MRKNTVSGEVAATFKSSFSLQVNQKVTIFATNRESGWTYDESAKSRTRGQIYRQSLPEAALFFASSIASIAVTTNSGKCMPELNHTCKLFLILGLTPRSFWDGHPSFFLGVVHRCCYLIVDYQRVGYC